VSYYDPIPWIDPSDNLIDIIEDSLKVVKVAKSLGKTKGRSYLPLNELELSITSEDGGEILRLTEWVDRIGRFHLRLVSFNISYRRGDFKVKNYHHNPNGANIPPPHHIHFPTVKYPLDKRHTYAHPVRPATDKTGADYISALRLFCDYTNIILSRVSIPLIKQI